MPFKPDAEHVEYFPLQPVGRREAMRQRGRNFVHLRLLNYPFVAGKTVENVNQIEARTPARVIDSGKVHQKIVIRTQDSVYLLYMRKLLMIGILIPASYWLGMSQAQSTGRVFEMRTYTTLDGKLPDLEKRFRDHTIRIFEHHGMTSIGYWVPQDSPKSENTLVYIIAHESREQAKKNWDDFRNDPEWKKVSAESEANGKLVSKVESVFLTPTDFSKIK